ncbi:MAG: SbcC/MukB-like Walker B domain-containing protein, partial [Chitinophagales bacterium]
PGVASERLGRVGEVVNNLEEYRRNLADVAAKAEAVGRLDAAQLALAEVLVQEAAQQYLKAQGLLGSVAGRLKDARESLSKAQAGLTALEEQGRQRAEEEAALEAVLAELRSGDEADLPGRLQDAKEKVKAAEERVAELDRRCSESQAERGRLEKERQRAAEQFAERQRDLAASLERLAGTAERLAWPDAAQRLRQAGRAVQALAVTDQELPQRAAPDLALVAEARSLEEQFRQAAAARQALDEAERAFTGIQTKLEVLRASATQLADRVEEAKDQAEERAEDVVQALLAWQERSEALEPSDVDLARVATRLRELSAPPAAGYQGLIEPLTDLAASRRPELQARMEAAEERERVARLRVDRLAERVAEIEADPGDPGRSEVRARARAGLSPQLQPLFRWARFKAEVAQETAALVETAILEAGWLDLLILPAGEEDAGLADARFLPAPGDGPTLLDILEPEPGAPVAVAEALASIGWGEGPGPYWVAPDGRWRNGRAEGCVAPWAEEAPGYFGQENRARRRERRLAQARTALDEARTALAVVQAERAAAAARLEALGAELAALDRLPWQELFGALSAVQTLEEQLARARETLEAEKPALQRAEALLGAATREFHRLAEGLPGAAGLTQGQFFQRSSDFGVLAAQIEALAGPVDELSRLSGAYLSGTASLARNQQVLDDLAADVDRAREALAASVAAVETLEARLADPDLQARQRRLEEAMRRSRELDREHEEARDRQKDLEVARLNAAQQIEQLAPQEAELRQELGKHLERVRLRLQLHPELAAFLEALDREGPVATMRRLPRPAGEEPCDSLILQRRSELADLAHQEQDLLRDYRPAWNSERTGLTFYDERLPLFAHQLRERLEARAREYADLMAEEQRKLFEDIIYEGILDELRRLIRGAKEFTRRTNEKLKALRLSSGEQLSLRLSPRSPEQTAGARIAHELEQMEQGSRWLDETKRGVLLATIRDEVERVRDEAREAGEELGYHEAVTRALDYRLWYEFQLLSLRPGNSAPVPIRSKGFGQRSTSDKAWALAVPVLAAVAARYDASPRTDVPRLIGLDEAFAGLDVNNQENYLGFLTQLGFSWIITAPDELPYSQSLSAAMAYRMSLEGKSHLAFPILWTGQRAWEPLEDLVREAAPGSQP